MAIFLCPYGQETTFTVNYNQYNIARIGCITNLIIQYQAVKDSTSTIRIKPSRPIENVVVVLDGSMV
jgi:hypothetical protein